VNRRGLGLIALLVAATGCQFDGVNGVSLPGGANTGKHPYHVTIEFADVLDLVPQSAVKVDDVTVGTVEKVTLDKKNWHARVRVKVRDSVHLPGNAVADLRQTSLLGEKFVSLAPPSRIPPEGRLTDGDTIPIDRTGRAAEVEEVFSALSLVLNGGGVGQLQTINHELATALSGREDGVRDLLQQLKVFVGGLDRQKQDIVRALEGLDRLTTTLAKQKDTIATALTQITPGVGVLADQRAQLTTMLTALGHLSDVGSRVVRETKDDVLADLRNLQPILTQLTAAGDYLPKSLELLLTYPFPKTVNTAIRGDYTNLWITADLTITDLLQNLVGNKQTLTSPQTTTPPAGSTQGQLPGGLLPGQSVLPGQSPTPGPGGATTPPTAPPGQDQNLIGLLLGGLLGGGGH
jgi:phospholipid/cholesterol/gamma-HCH transport system substrate-binding protein